MNRPLFTMLIALMGASSACAGVINSDVLVYGATSGGITAAVQAARQGKSVVLLSSDAYVGGMTTGGLSAADVAVLSTVGGLAKEFYQRLGARYGSSVAYYFEPHVAREEFQSMLTTANVAVRYNQRVTAVTKSGQRIAQIAMDDGMVYVAKMFVDASYEGDLMALAGVTWTTGRESNVTYGESLAGVSGYRVKLSVPVDPYLTPGAPDSGLIPQLQVADGAVNGTGDNKLTAYNFRLCLTNWAPNRLPIPPPDGYAESQYELLARYIEARVAAGATPSLSDLVYMQALPNFKADVNNSGQVSTDLIGQNYDYPTASYAQRAQIAATHLAYVQGMLYFLGNSSRVPADLRSQMLNWGLCADEFQATGGLPPQLYVRECRRMVSDYVMQQADCLATRIATKSVGLASYPMDCHYVQRYVKNGVIYTEGPFLGTIPGPYPVSYLSIVPRVGECENLLVPWSLSASHVAFCSIRMEPNLMILGQSAGAAAALAIDENVAVQAVDYPTLNAQLRADGQELGPATPDTPDTIVDDGDSSGVKITGQWYKSSVAPGYIGSGYRHDGAVPSPKATISFTPNLPVSGYYNVYLRWTADTNRATNVPVELSYPGATIGTTMNEKLNGNVWNLLNGSNPIFLSAGAGATVLIRTVALDGTPTDGFVVADAVRFALVAPAVPTVQIVASDPTAREDLPADSARFTVVRDSAQTGAAWTVNYSVTGTATAGVDYLALSGTVVIPAGAISAPIYITSIPHQILEGDETVTLTLQPGSNFQVGSLASATATIVEKPPVQIVATDDTARESDPLDTATFTVSRDPSATADDWTVSYQVGGTATPGLDYTALSGSVTIPAGATSATIVVSAVRDSVPEGTETVVVTLLPGTAFSVGVNGSASVNILDLPIDAWRFAQFSATELADPTLSGDLAVPDSDGIPNIAKYVFGLPTHTLDVNPTTSGLDESGNLTLSYRQLRSATDVAVIAEGSTDLATWSADPAFVQESSRVANGDFDQVTVRLLVPGSASGFLRLRITRP